MPVMAPQVHVGADAVEAGVAAAHEIAAACSRAAAQHGRVRMLFASAPSQQHMLDELRTLDIDWSVIEAFHVDEYVGLDATDPRGFGAWLRERLFDRVPIGALRFINPRPVDVAAEAERYGALLASAPIDVACIGIGVNGHIAFNEPYEWEIEGGPLVARVRLHDASRQQQVDDKCFDALDEVPHEALTLTVPAILRAGEIIVTVPGPEKADAVRMTLEPGVVPSCPATALQSHPRVRMFVDRASFALAGTEVADR